MATAMAATSIILALTMGFLLYLEIHKINKQVLEIQEQIHFLTNEINKLDKKLNPQKQTKDPIKKLIKG